MVVSDLFKQMFFPHSVWARLDIRSVDYPTYLLVGFLHFMLLFFFRFLGNLFWDFHVSLCMYEALLTSCLLSGLWLWMSLLLSILSSVFDDGGSGRITFVRSLSILLVCMLPFSIFGVFGIFFSPSWRFIFLGVLFFWTGILFRFAVSSLLEASEIKRFVTGITIIVPWSVMGIVFSQWVSLKILVS